MRLIDADKLDKRIYEEIPIKEFGTIKRMARMREIIAEAPTVDPWEPQARLMRAEEVQQLKDKTVICVEQLISNEDEEHEYVTGKAWGIVCNRTNDQDGGMIISMLGTFMPNTVKKIPYCGMFVDETKKKHRVMLFRFWTNRPTEEQSKAVKWE